MRDRRSILRTGTLAVAALTTVGTGSGRAAAAGGADPARAAAVTPQQALDRLAAGNAAWVADRAARPDATAARRGQVATRQDPFAVVFSCIDSRVPPELIFDQGLGDLMVVRTAAHTGDALVDGSLEYGPAELGVPLLVVLGHQRCGAVTAAVNSFRDGGRLPGHLADIARELRRPYEQAVRQGAAGEGLVDAVIREQTRRTVERLRGDRLLRPLVAADRLRVVGAHYSLDTGAVEFSV